MPTPKDDKGGRIKRVTTLLPGLKGNQIGWLEEIAKQFNRPHSFERNDASDIISDCMLGEIGDALRLHHCFSKDRTEAANKEHCHLKLFHSRTVAIPSHGFSS